MEYTVNLRVVGASWRDIDAYLDYIASDEAQGPFEIDAYISAGE